MKVNEILNEGVSGLDREALLKLATELKGQKVYLEFTNGANIYDPDVQTMGDEVETRYSGAKAKIIDVDVEFDRDGIYADEPGGIEVEFTPKLDCQYYDAEKDRDRNVKVKSGWILISSIASITKK